MGKKAKKQTVPLKLVNRNSTFTPHFQQVKGTNAALSPQPTLDFAERWKHILAEHEAYRILHRAQSAVDASGTLLSKRIIQDTHNTRFAVHHEKLAKGGSGRVRIAQNLSNKSFCIMKRSTDGDEKALEEAAILKKLNLFEGIRLKKMKDGTEVSYLFMKRLPGVTLHDFRKLCNNNDQTLSLNEQARLLLSTLVAMQQLINQHINHGDVHDKNVLIDPLTWQAHLIDFGDSSFIPENGSKNHHQHYDIKRLLQALKGLVTHHSLLAIAAQYLDTWNGLKTNLQSAIDCLHVLTNAPLSENQAQNATPSPKMLMMK